MRNVGINMFVLFMLGTTLLFVNIFLGIGDIMSENLQEILYPILNALGIETEGSLTKTSIEKMGEVRDIFANAVNFLAYFLVAYSIFSSFFVRATPLGFVMTFIFSIIIGATLNFVFITLYNNVVSIITGTGMGFSFDVGGFLLTNFSTILLANILAGALSFLYSAASSKFNKGSLLGI